MGDLVHLVNYAEHHGIDVDWFSMERAESLSMPLDEERYGIAIDPGKVRSLPDLHVKLAHEIGHCMTGSFYNRWAALDVRQKHENAADRWAIEQMVPKDELNAAVSYGRTEIWDLAEWFGVTPDFMKKAVCYYTHGNLAAEMYC